jgi:hypothetical protein
VDDEMSYQQPAFNVCPNCGTPAGPEDRFCRTCGLSRYGQPGAGVAAQAADLGTRGGRRIFIFLALAVAAGVLLAGAAFVALQSGVLSPKHTITGTFDLYGDSNSVFVLGSACYGSGGYADIKAGMPVTVKDESGKILGATTLGTGTGGTYDCKFTFSFTDVGDASVYSIEGGRRGAVSYTKAQMEQQNWMVGLQIGQ